MRFVFLVFLIFWSLKAMAQVTLTTLTPIDFGTFIVNDHSVATSVEINPSGSFIASSQLYHVEDPVPGQYRIINIPEGTPITLTIFDASIASDSNPGDPNMTITDYVVTPSSLVAAPGDFADFTLGATLELLGAGNVYNESQFSGTFQIDISF